MGSYCDLARTRDQGTQHEIRAGLNQNELDMEGVSFDKPCTLKLELVRHRLSSPGI